MTATFYVGDALEVMAKLPEKSVDLVLSSPPFLALRSYLPADHPDKAKEGGSQATPGEYIDWLVDVAEACARVLAPHGSLCFELGDTYAGSSGSDDPRQPINHRGPWKDRPLGDEETVARRLERQGYGPAAAHNETQWRGGGGWPLGKSLSLIPELFRLTLVYGTNPLTGRQTERWRLRNVIRWVRPNPPVGALGDKFRPATSELMVFCKSAKRYFDLDAVRTPMNDHTLKYWEDPGVRKGVNESRQDGGLMFYEKEPNPAGAPPLDWWEISLLDGEEPRKMAPKPSANRPRDRYPDRLMPSERAGRNDRKRSEGEQGHAWTSPLNPGGAPPLDWWQSESSPQELWWCGFHHQEMANGTLCFAALHFDLGPDNCKPVKRLLIDAADPGIPLDWWNIPPGGYEGAHYAVFPPELCVKPIKAMCPEKVCKTCGEPRRRIVNETTRFVVDERQLLADEIATKRRALGLRHVDMVGWFSWFKPGESARVQISGWERAINVPTPEAWDILKTRLGVDPSFDGLVYGERTWQRTENLAEYVPHGDPSRQNAEAYAQATMGQNPSAQAMPKGRATKIPKDAGFSDCGHDDYRPGLVLDPFVGSGTVLAVATGHGREAIGIDLDERNYELALERVGPMFLQRGEVPA